jgi:hypothetical protein
MSDHVVEQLLDALEDEPAPEQKPAPRAKPKRGEVTLQTISDQLAELALAIGELALLIEKRQENAGAREITVTVTDRDEFDRIEVANVVVH